MDEGMNDRGYGIKTVLPLIASVNRDILLCSG